MRKRVHAIRDRLADFDAAQNDAALTFLLLRRLSRQSYFGVFRGFGRPPFTEEERDVLAYALRGIKWFHRQLLLSHELSYHTTHGYVWEIFRKFGVNNRPALMALWLGPAA